MSIMWGPALDAEVAYRGEQVRGASRTGRVRGASWTARLRGAARPGQARRVARPEARPVGSVARPVGLDARDPRPGVLTDSRVWSATP